LSILHLRSSILNLLYSHSFIRSRKIAGILLSTSRRTSIFSISNLNSFDPPFSIFDPQSAL